MAAHRSGWRTLGLAILCAALLTVVAPAVAQISASAQDNGQPVRIEADEGIEWRRNDQVYEANGNAVATRGTLSVRANTLRAFYRDRDGRTDIFMLEAVGNVVITSPDMVTRGDRAVYDIDAGSLVLSGRDVQLETDAYLVYADGNLEYYEVGNYAVANGGAKAVSGNRELRADALYAYFTGGGGPADDDAEQEVERLVADGNMVIVTDTEIVQAQRGTYFPQTEIAMAEGDVQITRGDSHLVGEVAEVNLVTGVSRIMAGRPGEPRRPRVIGVFTPQSLDVGKENQ